MGDNDQQPKVLRAQSKAALSGRVGPGYLESDLLVL